MFLCICRIRRMSPIKPVSDCTSNANPWKPFCYSSENSGCEVFRTRPGKDQKIASCSRSNSACSAVAIVPSDKSSLGAVFQAAAPKPGRAGMSLPFRTMYRNWRPEASCSLNSDIDECIRSTRRIAFFRKPNRNAGRSNARPEVFRQGFSAVSSVNRIPIFGLPLRPRDGGRLIRRIRTCAAWPLDSSCP